VDSDGEGRSGQRPALSGVGAPRREVSGVVTEVLPHAMYRVRLDDGGRQVLAHVADRIDRNFVRVLTGDRVRVELMPADAGRGRIVEKIQGP
jgi:translation initiation factor IF-1